MTGSRVHVHLAAGARRRSLPADAGRVPAKFEALAAAGIALFPQDGSGIVSADQIVVASAAVEEDVADMVRARALGCKVLRRDVLATLLPRMRERRFAFDLEFFVAAKAAGINGFVGAPVRLEERVAGSTVPSTAILRTIRDTFVIFGRLHLTRQYRPVQAAAPAAPAMAGSQWDETAARAA